MDFDHRRIFTSGCKFALIKPESGKGMTLTGYPLVWNVTSSDRGGYKVRLMPNSAKFATPTLALSNHNFASVIGNTENGTLRLKPDDYGVKCEIDLPATTLGSDTATLVADKYVDGMSFSMVDAPDGKAVTENGQTIFNATNYIVDEVTVTAIPSFLQAAVAIKKPGDTFSTRINHSLQVERFRFDLLETMLAQ